MRVFRLLPLVLVAASASAQDPYFPETPLSEEKAAELLSAEAIGPPATHFDGSARSPGAALDVERLAEGRSFGADAERLAASDALRRWGHLMLRAMRTGAVSARQADFLAEHVGLATPPSVLFSFATSDVGDLPELNAYQRTHFTEAAVVLDCQPIGCFGLIVGTASETRLEPFPRRGEPGGVIRVPGLLLSEDAEYTLYAVRPGVEVAAYPLPGTGRFDVEVPLPEEPGAYRVAVHSAREGRLPRRPFAFTLYSGVEPPTMYSPAPDLVVDGTGVEAIEEAVVAAINAGRTAHGLEALVPVGEPETLRNLLQDGPDEEGAYLEHLQRGLSRDPARELPHGVWKDAVLVGRDAADVAEVMLEHPAMRLLTMDPSARSIVLGVQSSDVPVPGLSVVFQVIQQAPSPEVHAERLRQLIAARWGADPLGAPQARATLDELASKVARGEVEADVASRVAAEAVQTHVGEQYGVGAILVPPGEVLGEGDLPAFEPSKHLAVGRALGDLGKGDGIYRTVLLVLAADEAD